MAYGDLLVPYEKEVCFTKGLLWFYVLQGKVGIIVLTSILPSSPSCFPPSLLANVWLPTSACQALFITPGMW